MSKMPISPTIRGPREWKTKWVGKFKGGKKNPDDIVYAKLKAEDHPGCQVVLGIDENGSITTTGFVDSGGQPIRRVTKVPPPKSAKVPAAK